MGVTVTGADELIVTLRLAPQRLAGNLYKATRVTCTKVKSSARSRISGHRRLPAYPSSITYDIAVGAESIEGEIGPDKELTQGPLGNLLEFGTSHAPPMPHLGPALDENTADFYRGVDIAVAQAIT